MSSAGHAASSSGCVARPGGRETGLIGFAAQIRRSSPIGSYVMETVEHREPCESRGSRTVLGARGGEIPPRDSTFTSLPPSRHVRFAQERTFGESWHSAREPLAGKAVLCDRDPFRGGDRLASDVEPLVQHIVHAALAYIVARRDRVLIFASPMSEPDIDYVIER